ncbi:unnamed protein product [Rotaria sp. Silwood2]|nr:unnamed protein product [Rotaria sp. Silwood2]
MANVSIFEILPEEIRLHVFQYLSCADIVYSFSNLNTRFNATLTHVCNPMNFNSITYQQFDCLMSNILPKIGSNIRSFVVNEHWANFISNKLHPICFKFDLSSIFPNLHTLVLDCFTDADLLEFIDDIRDLKQLVKLVVKRLDGQRSYELLEKVFTANNRRLKSVLFDYDSLYLSVNTNNENVSYPNIEELTLNLIYCDMIGNLFQLVPNIRRLHITFGESPGVSLTSLTNAPSLIHLKEFELHSIGMFWKLSDIADILSKIPSLHKLTLDLSTDDKRLVNGQNLPIILPSSLIEIQFCILYYFSESQIKIDSLVGTWPNHIPISCWLHEFQKYAIIHTTPYNVFSMVVPATMGRYMLSGGKYMQPVEYLKIYGESSSIDVLMVVQHLHRLRKLNINIRNDSEERM